MMAADHSQGEVLVLADRASITGARALRTQLFILIAVLAAIGSAIWYVRAPAGWSAISWRAVFLHSLQFLFVLAAIAVELAWTHRARKLERMVLSREGLRYISPMPTRLKWICPDSTLEWEAISSVGLTIPGSVAARPELVTMSFNAGARTKRIRPVCWVDPDTYVAPVTPWWKFEARRYRMQDVMDTVMDSEVIRYVSRHVPQLAIQSGLSEKASMTALEHNRHGMMAIGILFLLLAYTLVDIVAGPESYADEPLTLLPLYVAAGVIGAIMAGIWLRESALKSAEKVGLAMLLGIMTAVAMLPGALRINAFFDKEGLVTYDTRVVRGGRHVILQPLAAGVPAIHYFAPNPYWDKFGKDDLCPVRMRKGILGFYQFDSASIVELIRRNR